MVPTIQNYCSVRFTVEANLQMPDIHSNTFYGIRFIDGDVCSVQSSVADLHEDNEGLV